MLSPVKGGILWWVLLVSGCVASVAVVLMQSAILQQKQCNAMNHRVTTEQAMTRALTCQMHCLERDDLNSKPQFPVYVTKLCFVPDTLHYSETEGVQYYQLSIESPSSSKAKFFQAITVAVRDRMPVPMAYTSEPCLDTRKHLLE